MTNTLESTSASEVELYKLDEYYKKLILQERASFEVILNSKVNVAQRDAERKF